MGTGHPRQQDQVGRGSLNGSGRLCGWELMQRFVAALVLLPAFPVMVAAGLLIRLNSDGPIFFCQDREGHQGRVFRMFKLRTMAKDAEAVLGRWLEQNPVAALEWQVYGCLRNDPRIAGVAARWARRFSVDELPQLFNVVTGDMNLVGPRPLPLDICSKFRDRHRHARRAVRPGITGLWQVSGRSDMQIEKMARLDVLYVKRRSICLDLLILLRTMPAVASGRGAY